MLQSITLEVRYNFRPYLSRVTVKHSDGTYFFGIAVQCSLHLEVLVSVQVLRLAAVESLLKSEFIKMLYQLRGSTCRSFLSLPLLE